MGEYTYDEDIDALATHLHEVRQNEGNWWCDPDSAKDWSRALTALVAERDELRQRVAVLESQEFTLPTDPFRDPDRDLRERLVCAALTGLCADPRHDVTESVAVAIADRTLAAMRKEEA